MKRTVLVVDDDPALLNSLTEILEGEGYEVTAAADGESGLRCLKEQAFDLVLSDLALPGLNGMELLKYLQQEKPAVPCIIITGYGTIANAVSAMHQGAYDYFTKPVDPTELRLVVARALEHRRLKWENLHLKKQLHRRYGFANMVGTSDGITKNGQVNVTLATDVASWEYSTDGGTNWATGTFRPLGPVSSTWATRSTSAWNSACRISMAATLAIRRSASRLSARCPARRGRIRRRARLQCATQRGLLARGGLFDLGVRARK